MRLLMLPLLAALVLTGCGDDDEQERAASNTLLIVNVYPEGEGGPVKERTVTDATGLTAKMFEPVPADVACTEIYGGPQTATVAGRLNGRTIEAEFSRNNGCEIARWDKLEKLLGKP